MTLAGFAGATDPGRRRRRNEDSYVLDPPEPMKGYGNVDQYVISEVVVELDHADGSLDWRAYGKSATKAGKAGGSIEERRHLQRSGPEAARGRAAQEAADRRSHSPQRT